ncbi:MAG: hypothetical protein RBR54_09175 [Sulfurimonas sp.]|jgi:hypothetical protein|nr:hypothetical protein [Sulfurimonas sp.]
MNNNNRFFLTFIIFIILKFSLFATEFDIKAFGTLGAVYQDKEEVKYRKDLFAKDGASGDVSLKTDSVLGAQLRLQLDESFSFVAQGIVQNDYEDHVKAKIDWGYLKYDGGQNLVVKLGRIRTPFYRNSENLNIGYSNLMIREAAEVYAQVPFTSYNGVEVAYSDLIDTYFYTLQMNYGEESLNVPIHSLNEEVDVDIEKLFAMNLTVGTEAIQLRGTYMRACISARNTNLDQLFGSLSDPLADQYEFRKRRSEYRGVGLFIDMNNILFMTEYGQRRIGSFYADTEGAYATLAYNFDTITPFVTLAKSKMNQKTYGVDTGSVALDKILESQNVAQRSSVVGVKYVINENVDVKVQYENIVADGDYGGVHLHKHLQNVPELHALSFALDFIY